MLLLLCQPPEQIPSHQDSSGVVMPQRDNAHAVKVRTKRKAEWMLAGQRIKVGLDKTEKEMPAQGRGNDANLWWRRPAKL